MAEDSPSVWDDALLANPHVAADKRLRVRKMFAAIAPSYDLNNRLHSFGMDQLWRKTAVKLARVKPTDKVLDVACGTGDLTLRFAKQLANLGGKMPLGIDFTFEMLPIAQRKSRDAPTSGQHVQILPPDVVTVEHGYLPIGCGFDHPRAVSLR